VQGRAEGASLKGASCLWAGSL